MEAGIRLLAIHHPLLHLITVAHQFRRVHAFDGRRQCGDEAGGFGAHAVANAVLASGERREEETNSVVAEFALSGQTFEPVAAALVVRFEAAGFVDFQHQIFVFVLAVDDEFHFNQRLARQKPSVLNRNAFVLRDLL